MSEDLYEIIAANNLPLYSWPYLREHLSNIVSRMGWLPFTLPVRTISATSHASPPT